MQQKTQKELAFLHDLYISTGWVERFAELVDQHVPLPKEGRALYVEAGTGNHALALQGRAGRKLTIICADQNEESVELARAKAVALHEPTEFQHEHVNALSFKDDQYDLVLGNASLTLVDDLKANLRELVRVAKPGGSVAWWLPTFSSFGEFFSIYWEALLSAGFDDHGGDVENMITGLPTISDVEKWSAEAGLEQITSKMSVEEFDYQSGEQFLNSPLIADFLLPNWIQPLPEGSRATVVKELSRIIDEDRHAGEFVLTLKATLVVGKKSRVQ
ncbi:MAG: class I SAM-dependent methyltransferase [Pyrinomonadaceae bacterium]